MLQSSHGLILSPRHLSWTPRRSTSTPPYEPWMLNLLLIIPYRALHPFVPSDLYQGITRHLMFPHTQRCTLHSILKLTPRLLLFLRLVPRPCSDPATSRPNPHSYKSLNRVRPNKKRHVDEAQARIVFHPAKEVARIRTPGRTRRRVRRPFGSR